MRKLLVSFLVLGSSVSMATERKTVRIDGSSTVFPITEAMAEEFSTANQDINVTVGVSGTGGGFKKFTAGEIDINNASREITPIEIATAQKNSIEYLAIPVAYDGITVVVSKKNTWAKDITTEELKAIWGPGSKIKTWKEVRASWPNEPIHLFGPGVDSGTFDYFTEAINGKSHVSRTDFTKSEDDNVLVKVVEGDKNALAYFGFAYYKENASKLNALKINNGKAVVEPSEKNINDGTYSPLSRAVYIYVAKKAAKKSEVQAFVKYYINEAIHLVHQVGYVPLKKETYTKSLGEFEKFAK